MSTTICPTCQQPHTRAQGNLLASADELTSQMCIGALHGAMESLLRNIGDPGECRACHALIFWVKHRNGRKTPYTPAGLNHFVDCPAREEFKR